jgi:lipoxygenase
MAVTDPDPNNPTGVKLLFEDYPYGKDGLDIWTAIKTWVTDFCSIFYKDDDSVKADSELQSWWEEIQTMGHCDKQYWSWWYK